MTLAFVDPDAVETSYRVLLWAAPGEGKTVGACSAPGPILVLSADRPTAYKFAREHHKDKDIREYRWTGMESLAAVYQYLRSPDGEDVRTLVVDPVSNIVEAITTAAPKKDGGPDYQWVNAKLLGFIRSFRPMNVNVVLCAYEKWNDHKKFGDGKLYPAVGGAGLINKVCGEMDIVAHVERHEPEDGETQWIAQLQPTGPLVCKESTGKLGARRVLDLTRWFAVANGDA